MGAVDRIVLLGQLGAPAPLPVVAGEQLGITKSYSSNWDVGVIDSRQHAYFEGRGVRRYPTPSVGPRCSSTALGEPDATWTTTYIR